MSKYLKCRRGVWDDKTTDMLEGWLNGGPEGLAAFKAWACLQPQTWHTDDTKEGAERWLEKNLKLWFRPGKPNFRAPSVFAVTQNGEGKWDVTEARLQRKLQEIEAP